MGLTKVEKEGIETLINNNADNRVITGSGTANTLNGEANLTFDGSKLLINTTTEGHSDADDLTIETSSGYCGITLRSPTDQGGAIYFSDGTSGAAEYDGQVLYSQNSQTMTLAAGGTGRLNILNTGNIEITNGDLVIGGTGHGIDFSNSQTPAGGMTSELFDHYEEGTFTPSVTGGLAGGSITYNTRSGQYTRTGNVVNFTIYIKITSCSLDSGGLTFGGLPFTSVNATNTAGGMWKIFSSGNIDANDTYKVVGNSTTIQVITGAGDARAANTTSIDAGGRTVAYWGFYFV